MLLKKTVPWAAGMWVVALPLAAAQGASAEEVQFYAGAALVAQKASFGRASETFRPVAPTPFSSDDCKCKEAGLKIFGGWRNSSFGVEVAYAPVLRQTDTDRAAAGGTVSRRLNGHALSLDAMGFLPLGDRVSLFGSLGAAYVDVSMDSGGSSVAVDSAARRSQAGPSPKIGLGVDVRLGTSWSLRAGIDRYTRVGKRESTGRGSITQASAGVAWSF